jgi:hypothetical protein
LNFSRDDNEIDSKQLDRHQLKKIKMENQIDSLVDLHILKVCHSESKAFNEKVNKVRTEVQND